MKVQETLNLTLNCKTQDLKFNLGSGDKTVKLKIWNPNLRQSAVLVILEVVSAESLKRKSTGLATVVRVQKQSLIEIVHELLLLDLIKYIGSNPENGIYSLIKYI